jgi:hypothetical protein
LLAQGLLDDLKGPGPLTLFAPTNEVFSALDIQPGMPTEASILLYHIVSELIEPLQNGKVYTTLNGANVAITIMATESSVNDVNIDDNIEASNGLVYVDNFRMNTHYGRYGAAYNMIDFRCFNEELSLLPKNPTEAKLQATSTRGESTEPT